MSSPRGAGVVTRIGQKGDGVVLRDERALHLRFVLPGEEVRFEQGEEGTRLVAILGESSDRVTPICRYFGECGGCKLQHWRSGPYLAWKRSLVIEALAAQGFPVEELERLVDETVDAHGAGRRRVTYHARREGGAMRVGFMRAGSHALVPIG